MIRGFPRPSGAVGARNHVLVLPSVVCSALVAERIAGEAAVAVTHQHGCAVVGDDVEHTAGIFSGLATNPNVAAALVVGLGCETIQGTEVVRRIAAAGQSVRYVGVQAEGGTERTIARGRETRESLRAEADAATRQTVAESCLSVGLDDEGAPFAGELGRIASAAGARLVTAEGVTGGEAHPELAAQGAQVIVAWCGPGSGPRGFAICPVLSVADDPALLAAMPQDFDLDGTSAPDQVARAVWERVRRVFDGYATAAERRGARDFYLRRLARTM